jgi:hypothetical protein
MTYDIGYTGSFYLRKGFTDDSDQYLSKVEIPLTERLTNFHSGLLTLRYLTAHSVSAHISKTAQFASIMKINNEEVLS